MPGIVGQDNTFNSPNFVGPLFLATPLDTPVLSAAGGLSGGRGVTATTFTWQGYDLRPPGQNVALEGANAPVPQERTRYAVSNVVEIHHEAIEVSYTRQAAVGFVSGGTNVLESQPVTDELTFQVEAMLPQIARDINYSFINGVGGVLPSDNTTARKTNGLLNAITSNIVPAAAGTGNAPLTLGMIRNLALKVFQAGGLTTGRATLLVSPAQKINLTSLYKDPSAGRVYSVQADNIGGVSVDTVVTDFGVFNVMVDRMMPDSTIALVDFGSIVPTFLNIPGKGHLFIEPLAQVGASYRYQIYGEVGLQYGNEKQHGKITNLTPPVFS